MHVSMSDREFDVNGVKSSAQITQGNFGIDVEEAEGKGFTLQVRASNRRGQVILLRVVGAEDANGVQYLTVTPYEPDPDGKKGDWRNTKAGEPVVCRSPDKAWL